MLRFTNLNRLKRRFNDLKFKIKKNFTNRVKVPTGVIRLYKNLDLISFSDCHSDVDCAYPRYCILI